MDWLPLWESLIVRLAAVSVASGIVFRYVIFPTFRGLRSSIRRYRDLVTKIRVAAHIIERELTTNGGSSVVDKISHLADQHNDLLEQVEEIQRDQALMAGSAVRYAFEHSQDHSSLFTWLKDEYGMDRRGGRNAD